MQRLTARVRRWGAWEIRAYDKERRRKAKRELSSARRGCAEAIERFDAFEAALDRCAGRWSVSISTPVSCIAPSTEALIEQVARRIESLARSSRSTCASTGPGAGAKERVAPARGVGRALVGAGGEFGVPAGTWSGRCTSVLRAPGIVPVSSSARRLRGTARPTRRGERIAARGEAVLQRHRASSAIEGFNAALRPYLYVHKATQGTVRLVQSAHAALGTASPSA